MPVPDYQALMLPLLRMASDGHEHTAEEVTDRLAKEFRLEEVDRREILPSGRQSKFDNRVGWARTYLKKAGLLQSTGRARFRITQLGLAAIQQNPPRIDVKFLLDYPQFVEFRRRRAGEDDEEDEDESTPEEVLESKYQVLRRQLAQELLDRVKSCSAKFFENLVVDLLLKMNYGGTRKDAGQAIGQTGDGGIDGIIKQDRLGLDIVYIQAKRWEKTVGEPTVRDFAGALEGKRARRGVLITTSSFSPEAMRYVNNIEKKIVLIEGDQLAQLMIDHGVGVTEVAAYSVKRIDQDYFETEEL